MILYSCYFNIKHIIGIHKYVGTGSNVSLYLNRKERCTYSLTRLVSPRNMSAFRHPIRLFVRSLRRRGKKVSSISSLGQWSFHTFNIQEQQPRYHTKPFISAYLTYLPTSSEKQMATREEVILTFTYFWHAQTKCCLIVVPSYLKHLLLWNDSR